MAEWIEIVRQYEVVFWNIFKQIKIKITVTTVQFQDTNNYDYEMRGRDTPFIFRRGYILLKYKNAALFCAENSFFEMFLKLVACGFTKCLA